MSSTTTTTATRVAPTRTADTILADYELHHSGGNGEASGSDRAGRAQRPHPNWDTTHRRVPPHRPINRDRDPLETRVYNSTAEQVFIGVMFTGVAINSTAAKMWHGTFGKLNDGIFRYRVGGEI